MEITKLNPQDIMNYWPQIKECINASLPPHIKDCAESLLKIQENLLIGILDCWMGYEPGNQSKVYALATTGIVTDEFSGTRNLLVYTLSTLNPHPQAIWHESLEYLSKYARSKNCENIIAYTNLPEVENIVLRIGGDTSWKLLYFKMEN